VELSTTSLNSPIPKVDKNILVEYWIRMYKKLILNFITFGKKFLKKLNDDLKLDIEDVEKAGEFLVYNTAWGYISNVDVNDPLHYKILKSHKDQYLSKYLILGIKHFELMEDYEKCAFLKKILDKLEET